MDENEYIGQLPRTTTFMETEMHNAGAGGTITLKRSTPDERRAIMSRARHVEGLRDYHSLKGIERDRIELEARQARQARQARRFE